MIYFWCDSRLWAFNAVNKSNCRVTQWKVKSSLRITAVHKRYSRLYHVSVISHSTEALQSGWVTSPEASELGNLGKLLFFFWSLHIFQTMIHYSNTRSKVPVLISVCSVLKEFLCWGITPGCPNYSHMEPHQRCHTNALLLQWRLEGTKREDML